MRLYRYFQDGVPWYLARHYWWAYLWRTAVWLFDHQPVINAILFGQYQKLMHSTMAALDRAPRDRVLQLSCVYGSLTPNLMRALKRTPLHLTDVAPIQLRLAEAKSRGLGPLMVTRMNAEELAYRDDTFTTVVLFFLLHEMPADARKKVLSECMRVIAPGGVLILT